MTLYDSGDKSFSLVGRYHGQAWSVESEDQKASDWENHRILFGFNSDLSKEFSFEFQVKFSGYFRR